MTRRSNSVMHCYYFLFLCIATVASRRVPSTHHHHHHHHHHHGVTAFQFQQKLRHTSCRSTTSALDSTSSSASAWSSSSSLECVFQEPYRPLVSNLNSNRITEMLPKSSSTTKSTPPLRQSLFSSPIIPFIYERLLPPLWNAGLRVGDMDEEYQQAKSFLLSNKNNNSGGNQILLDVSCGTGFIARRFAAERQFNHVIALDYSPEMLNECIANLQRTVALPANSLSIIQGDAMDLPFVDDSLEAIHWGAAMHCVPSAETALGEMHRVLKDGGKLYATTFLKPMPSVVFRFFTLSELQLMATQAGFSKVHVEQLSPVYAAIKCIK